MDTPVTVDTVIIAVLSRGLREGSKLFDEASTLLGSPPSMIVWRNTLIELTRSGAIERIIRYDDDGEKVIGVEYRLPNDPMRGGEQ